MVKKENKVKVRGKKVVLERPGRDSQVLRLKKARSATESSQRSENEQKVEGAGGPSLYLVPGNQVNASKRFGKTTLRVSMRIPRISRRVPKIR